MQGLVKNKHSLLKTLMLGIIGICAIAVIVLSIYALLQSPAYVRYSLGKENQSYSKTAAEILNQRLLSYCSSLSKLAQQNSLCSYLENHNFYAAPELYQILADGNQGFDSTSTLHLISSNRMTAISLGYNNNAYLPGDYAGIEEMLAKTDPVIIPKHFVNTSGDNIVLVIASAVKREDRILGYLCLDISDQSISDLFSASETLSAYRIAPYVETIITTWYHQLVFNNSSFKNIISRNGKYTVSESFHLLYDQSAGKSFLYTDSGHEYQICAQSTEDNHFKVITAIQVDFFLNSSARRLIPLIVICLLIASIGCFVSFKIYREILKPIDNIVKTMKKVDQGDMNARCSFDTKNELALVRDSLNQMIKDMDQNIRNNQEKQRLLSIAEYNVLKAQIKPHFINNVLDSIYWMLKLNKITEAEQAIMSFSKLISSRIQMNIEATEPLQDSLELTRHYITLQQLCYPGQFDVKYEIDEAMLSESVPVFLLQPLVENALLHGIQPKIGKGTIVISISKTDGKLYLKVSDDGVGMDERNTDNPAGHGIALNNIRRRLELFYRDEARLTIISSVGKGTDVIVQIPMKEDCPCSL